MSSICASVDFGVRLGILDFNVRYIYLTPLGQQIGIVPQSHVYFQPNMIRLMSRERVWVWTRVIAGKCGSKNKILSIRKGSVNLARSLMPVRDECEC